MMDGFQFLHIETYARVSPAKAIERRWTLREVVAELEREDGNHPHVTAHLPPTVVYGVAATEVECCACEAAEGLRDAGGRRLRRDSPLVISGVASYPVRLAEMTPAEHADYLRWEADTVSWLRGRFGGRLRSVVRHTDETFGHIHFLISPDFETGERIDDIHPGRGAAKAAKAANAPKRKQDQEYRRAMRELQDDYFGAVSVRHGLARRGPGRRRLTRTEWRAEQTQAHIVAATIHDVEQRAEQTRVTEAAARSEIIELAAGQVSEAEEAEAAQRERANIAERTASDLAVKIDAIGREASELVASMAGAGATRLPSKRPDWLSAGLWVSIVERAAAWVSMAQPMRQARPQVRERQREIER
jgi:hypothetical protein